MNTRLRRIAAAALALVLTCAATGCELMVQLDRSFVDAGEAGCNICSDAAFDDVGDGGEEAGIDTGAGARDSATTDGAADARASDAAIDTSTHDAAGGG